MDRAIKKKKFTTRKLLMILAAVIVIVSSAYLVMASTGNKLKVEKKQLIIQDVISGPFLEYIPLNGNVQPIKSIYIETVEGGKVEEILADDGVQIKAGTPIIRLANQQFQMDMINREAQLLDQQNNLRTARRQMDQQTTTLLSEALQNEFDIIEAKRNYEINIKLFADSAISKLEFERSRERYQYLLRNHHLTKNKINLDSLYRQSQSGQIESSLNLIYQNLNFLHKSMESLIVRAPIDGQLSQIQVELGETVSPGDRIAQVDDMTDLKVTTQVPEQYNSRLQVGQKARFTESGKEYIMTVSKIYPEIISGHFSIDLEFEGDKPENIRRGQTLQLKLALGNETQAIQVPRGSYFQHTGGNWIYAISDENEARKRPIKLGKQNSDYYEVLEGLAPGDRVITSGYDMFRSADILIISDNK